MFFVSLIMKEGGGGGKQNPNAFSLQDELMKLEIFNVGKYIDSVCVRALM